MYVHMYVEIGGRRLFVDCELRANDLRRRHEGRTFVLCVNAASRMLIVMVMTMSGEHDGVVND